MKNPQKNLKPVFFNPGSWLANPDPTSMNKNELNGSDQSRKKIIYKSFPLKNSIVLLSGRGGGVYSDYLVVLNSIYFSAPAC